MYGANTTHLQAVANRYFMCLIFRSSNASYRLKGTCGVAQWNVYIGRYVEWKRSAQAVFEQPFLC